jgi:hypothetical protein
MRNAMPLRWIEQAEARRVLAAALFERAPKPSWYKMALATVSQWPLGRARGPLGASRLTWTLTTSLVRGGGCNVWDSDAGHHEQKSPCLRHIHRIGG